MHNHGGNKMNVIKGIVWKEYRTLLTNIKGLIVMSLGCQLFIYIFIFVRMKSSGFSVEQFIGNVNYASLMIAYIVFISSLKFWHEKSMNTLEILFMFPSNMITLVIGKAIVPILISQVSVIFFYVVSCGALSFITQNIYFSIITIIQIIIMSVIFEVFYSIINCYAMWCASLNYAKIIQIISVILYLGAVFSVIVVPTKINFFTSPGVWIVMGIIGIYSFFCLKLINKEKAILTLPY